MLSHAIKLMKNIEVSGWCCENHPCLLFSNKKHIDIRHIDIYGHTT